VEGGLKVPTASITLSHLSTEYVLIPVSATVAGQPHNPTSDTVQFAFLASQTASPQSTDWVAASWSTASNAVYPYAAQCLVGPGAGAAVSLAIGTYVIWLKITDDPEVPVRQVGVLNVN
jgi:hypothetical protein